MPKKPTFVPDSEAFGTYIGDGFLFPDSASENNGLFVIGLHRSGDAIALFLQDWEVAKVALSCHIALDMLCRELHDIERRRGWFGF